MNNITVLPCITTLDIPVERILDGATKANLECCVVVGLDEDGELYFASTKADGGTVLWLFEKAKKALMET